MLTLTAQYQGAKKCLVLHPESFTLETATPRALGGDDSAFSPTDLVAAGLVTCILTTLGMWAERHGLELSGMQASVEKEMSPRGDRIARLAVSVTLPAERVPEELRARLEAIGYRCPVHASLHPDLDAPIFYEYG